MTLAKVLTSFILGLLVVSAHKISTVNAASTHFQDHSIEISTKRIPSPHQNWIRRNESESEAIKNLLSWLQSSQTGKKLVFKAKQAASTEGVSLLDIISADQTSMLDTTLIRRFSRHDPTQVEYVTRSKITINRNHNVRNALLDLAHELTHFVYREPFNPYQHDFSADSFIRSTIEGKGGEVQAYMMECQVLREIYPRYFDESSNCAQIVDSSGKLSASLAKEAFYRVGHYYRDYQKVLNRFKRKGNSENANWPEVSQKTPLFISSAWSGPYPLAALQEFTSIMERACQNDQQRLALLNHQGASRAPASTSRDDEITTMEDRVQQMMSSHQRRCQDFL